MSGPTLPGSPPSELSVAAVREALWLRDLGQRNAPMPSGLSDEETIRALAAMIVDGHDRDGELEAAIERAEDAASDVEDAASSLRSAADRLERITRGAS